MSRIVRVMRVIVSLFVLAAALHALDPIVDRRITAIQVLADGVLCGTGEGLMVVPARGEAGLLPGFRGFVTALAEHSGTTLVGTLDGPWILARGSAVPVALPHGTTDSQVSSAVVVNGRFFAGGAFGLVEVNVKGETACHEVPLPGLAGEVLSLSASDGRLLAACPGLLMVSSPAVDSWARVSEGLSYIRVAGLPGGRWVGLAAGGGADLGSLDPRAPLQRIELPYRGDVVTSIACAPASSPLRLFAGTMRGRILAADVTDGREPEWKMHGDTAPWPVRSLESGDDLLLYCGTEGAGLRILDADGRLLSTWPAAEAGLPPRYRMEPAAGGDEENRLLDRIRAAVTSRIALSGRRNIVAFLAIVIALALILGLLLRGASRDRVALKEKRRAHRTRIDLPALETLSPDLAEQARRLQALTDGINRVSRSVAQGHAQDLTDRAREISLEFEEVDAWMRSRLTRIHELRKEESGRLVALKAAAREGGDEERVRDELSGIESRLAALDRDERYLKYVLEE